MIPTPSDRNWLPRWSKDPSLAPEQSSGCRVGNVCLSPGQAGRRAQCWLRAVSGSEVLDGPELTVLFWPLQVDNQTEENNDMNKRRRRGFNSLHEVRVHSVGFNRGPWPQARPPWPSLLSSLWSCSVPGLTWWKNSWVLVLAPLLTSNVTLRNRASQGGAHVCKIQMIHFF